ncbi:MAG: helix-turn-helix domain-containing protein, partial [Nitrospira sp.]|nr:helix-turn-helix domain-containing protein [Nitrospira sp.]
ALTLAEREEISRGIAGGISIRCMADQLGRPPSTVSREIVRHGGRSRYRAVVADDEVWAHACCPKPCRFAFHPILQRTVADKLSLEWSSE